MNSDFLLRHYERVADAPDAIARLRRFILDLAVRGKLVAQDAGDEPASKLLERIAKEKARLGLKQAISPVESTEICFELPNKWVWCRIGELCSKTGSGSTPRGGKEVYKNSGIPFLRSQNIYDDGLHLDDVAYIDGKTHKHMNGTHVAAGDLLLNITGGSMGRCCRVPDTFREANISQHVAIIRVAQKGTEDFLHRVVLSPYFQSFVFNEQTGAGRGGLPKNRMDRIPVALPPLAEQHRIVAKVDELMALCDRLEAARAAREAVRDRLAAASLARLDTPDPEHFQDHARFAINSLPALTTRPDQIKQLRQTILNLAVRGKLVPQDADDESVSKFLTRIARKKAELIKAGVAKPDKPVERIDMPFELPKTWSWCSLGQLCRVITKGSSPKWQGISYVAGNDGLLFITSENVGHFSLRKLDELKYVEPRFKEVEPRSMLQNGDILVNLVGASIGRTAIYNLNEEANINQAVALVRLVDSEIGPSTDYLLMFLNSDAAVDLMLGSRVITAQPNISLADVSGFPIPLPPLAEQLRIVAKVDELMSMCDQLEESLTATGSTHRRLLDALLAKALAPPETRSQEEAA